MGSVLGWDSDERDPRLDSTQGGESIVRELESEFPDSKFGLRRKCTRAYGKKSKVE